MNQRQACDVVQRSGKGTFTAAGAANYNDFFHSVTIVPPQCDDF
jgi:hypothetical protein